MGDSVGSRTRPRFKLIYPQTGKLALDPLTPNLNEANEATPRIEDKLTTKEADALAAKYNLADAHTHQTLTDSELKIVDRFPQLFHQAERTTQFANDRLAFRSYMAAANQTSVVNRTDFLTLYASSISIELIANVFRTLGWTLALIEPTFDNIPDIFRRHSVALTALTVREPDNYGPTVIELLRRAPVDAVMLVNPNNPTGQIIGVDDFDVLARHCARTGTRLVLDNSFRIYDELAMYDQYAILDRHSVEYIAIEDTGKIWPTLDLKLSFIVASENLMPALTDVHRDLLLNVSGFIDQIVYEWATWSSSDGFGSVRQLTASNRNYLRNAVDKASLRWKFPYKDSQVSVEYAWLPGVRSTAEVAKYLASNGVAVLGGDSFYWASPKLGDHHMRIALARTPDYFREAIDRMIDLLVGNGGQV